MKISLFARACMQEEAREDISEEFSQVMAPAAPWNLTPLVPPEERPYALVL